MIDCRSKTDEEIVSLVLKDKDYFSNIVLRYEAPLRRYVRRLLLLTNEECDDLLQDIFVKAYSNINSFNVSLKFSSWIYRIAHNESISHYRKKKIRSGQISLEDDPELVSGLMSEIDIFEDSQKEMDKTVLLEAIEEINVKYREIIILKFFEEKDYTEISDILKIPSGTVATWLSRAKKELGKVLEEKGYKKHE